MSSFFSGDLMGAARLYGEAGTCYRKTSAELAVNAYLRFVAEITVNANLAWLAELGCRRYQGWGAANLSMNAAHAALRW